MPCAAIAARVLGSAEKSDGPEGVSLTFELTISSAPKSSMKPWMKPALSDPCSSTTTRRPSWILR